MKKLDPCPFCGEVPKFKWVMGERLAHAEIKHKSQNCACPLHMTLIYFAESEGAAINLWNRRSCHDTR